MLTIIYSYIIIITITTVKINVLINWYSKFSTVPFLLYYFIFYSIDNPHRIMKSSTLTSFLIFIKIKRNIITKLKLVECKFSVPVILLESIAFIRFTGHHILEENVYLFITFPREIHNQRRSYVCWAKSLLYRSKHHVDRRRGWEQGNLCLWRGEPHYFKQKTGEINAKIMI